MHTNGRVFDFLVARAIDGEAARETWNDGFRQIPSFMGNLARQFVTWRSLNNLSVRRPSTLLRARLIDGLRTVVHGFANQLEGTLQDHARVWYRQGSEDVALAANLAVGIPVVSPAALPSLQLSMLGRPFFGPSSLFDGLVIGFAKKIEDEIGLAIRMAEPTSNIVAKFAMSGSIAKMTTMRLRAFSVTLGRAATFEGARQGIIQAGPAVKNLQAIAMLDSATSVHCQKLAGAAWTVPDMGGVGHDIPAPDSLTHFMCRMMLVPVLDNYNQIANRWLPSWPGLPSERGSSRLARHPDGGIAVQRIKSELTGQLNPREAFPQFLARQTVNGRRRILGERRFNRMQDSVR